MTSVDAALVAVSRSALTARRNHNGSLRRMERGDVVLNLFLGNEMEGGTTNLYLRTHDGSKIEWIELLGPRSPAAFTSAASGWTARGEWRGIRLQLRFVLAQSAPAWFWHVELTNTRDRELEADVVYAQDLALAPYGAIRLNEYYVSQYLDYTPLVHPRCGAVLGVRQNQAVAGRNPWAMLGSLRRGAAFATDALQLYGLAARGGAGPAALAAADLPTKRLQHEHSMAVIQDAPLRLTPGAAATCGFFGWIEVHHAGATDDLDLRFADAALALPEATAPRKGESVARPAAGASAATLFSHRPLLEALDLDEADLDELFTPARRDVEREDGRDLSFFTGPNRHVVLRAKELTVLRPHGHILRSGDALVPDEASLTSTAWMAGTFHSMLTQGHVSINRFLSTTHGYLSLFRSHGLRVFVELDDGWRLLDVPSAFESSPSACRWVYKHRGGLIEIRSWAGVARHEMNLAIEVVAGEPRRLLLSCHVALDGDDGSEPAPALFTADAAGVTVRPVAESDLGRRFPEGSFRIDFAPGSRVERVAGDEALFLDGGSRDQPYVCVVTAPATAFGLRITGRLVESRKTPHGTATVLEAVSDDAAAADRFWREATGGVELHASGGGNDARDAARLGEILPWFAHDALVHYLAPRGLEQYSGGGWGTRDVTQGPVEMLLALGRWDETRDLLLRVFRQQNPDGDWPQWFMFFDRERKLRPGDSHGDIVFWPLLALAQYLSASEDASILDMSLPFFSADGDEDAENATLWAHAERALGVIARRVIPGVALTAYGHGDWNDALQPVDPSMRERLCSTWTATLHYQTLRALAAALDAVGRRRRAAVALAANADRIREDFHRLLLVDGILAGYAYFHDDGRIDHLLHPRDLDSEARYSVLPMIHAILADLLTPEQARAHVDCIRGRLLGPEGAHLFDRPFRYRGGPQRRFQRVESATFFGREIGNMYMHAHLRWAEALARLGDADAFFLALRQANPVSVRDVVGSATLRQRNCYSSSQDPVFADRYEGFEHYDRVARGEVALECGWRVYSSGAGIALRLVRERFLGLRQQRSALILDPVIPRSLDGLRARLDAAGSTFDVTYRVRERGCGPVALMLNGSALPFARDHDPYRTGGARVPMQALRERLREGPNALEITLQ